MTMGPVALVLGAPDDSIGFLIDQATGKRGWSHVAIDIGYPGPDPLFVDIDRTLGVVLSRRSCVFAEGRATLRIDIDPKWHAYVRRRAAYRLGEDYSLLAMALQPLQIAAVPGVYCSRVVLECLPPALAKRLPKCPAPADLLALLDRPQAVREGAA